MMNMVKHSTVDAVNAQLCWQILYFGLEPIEPFLSCLGGLNQHI